MTNIVKQLICPECGNWTDRALGACQGCGAALPPMTRKQLADAQQRADGSLTALREEQRRKAESLTVSEEQLAEWLGTQQAELMALRDRLGEALVANLARLHGADDPNWQRWYEQSARLGYVEETLRLVTERAHVLCCPNHPPADVDGEALSLRGLLAGEGATGYERYCLDCAAPQLEQAAKRLMRTHEAPIPEVGGYSGKPMAPVAPRGGAGGELGGKAVSTLGRGAK